MREVWPRSRIPSRLRPTPDASEMPVHAVEPGRNPAATEFEILGCRSHTAPQITRIAASIISIVYEMWRAAGSEMLAADDQSGTASRDFSLRNKFGPSCWSSRPFEGKP